MLRSLFVAAALAAASLASVPAARAEAILYDNTAFVPATLTVPGNFAGINYTSVGTAFSVAAAATAQHVDILLVNQPAAATVTVALRSDASGAPGAVLSSGDVAVVARAGQTLFSLDLPADVPLAAGTAYWITVTPTAGAVAWGRTGGPALALVGASTSVVPGNAMAVRVRGEFPSGACCNGSGGGCLVVAQADCAQFAGQFRGVGSACTPTTCVAVGACCAATGGCTLVGQSACPAPARWLGAGVTCGVPGLPNPCCPADFDNSSGRPELLDIFSFLQAWFAGCP